MLILFLSSGLWCQGTKQAAQTSRSCLVVAGGAVNVKRHKLPGQRVQLSYRVQAEYPANTVIGSITRKLKELGWKPLSQDFLNPGQSSSHVHGWDYYEDATTQPKTSVRYWQADWQNREHEVVTYRLEYRCPGNLCSSTYDLRELQVLAIYTPAKLSQDLKKSSRNPTNR